ncbi:hypothetical protein [Sphingomonas sp. IW22]|uniref:hypothetical protein n=1 Tax=Sphingomonas sp. IW22 TaxID=3242489 RepID=UPI00351F9602
MSEQPSNPGQVDLDLPATRQELFQVLQFTHLAFLSQSMVHAAMLTGDEDAVRRFGERAVIASGELLRIQRELFDKWGTDNA